MDHILRHISVSLANPSAAASLVDEIERCYASLEQTPLIYKSCRDPQLRALGYRRAIIKHYIMVYKVDQAEQAVIILRFFTDGKIMSG